jgi:hypothetical protein
MDLALLFTYIIYDVYISYRSQLRPVGLILGNRIQRRYDILQYYSIG